jgi:DNA repair ATPase RecN
MLNGRLTDTGLMSALSLATKFNPFAAPFFAVEGDVVQLLPYDKGDDAQRSREMLGHVVEHMATKENIARLDKRLDDLKTEMIDQFEHVEKQFHATHDRLRDIATEIAVIHRRVERLEELGASNAGFAKEIDHLLTRVAEIEKHLGIDKKISA